MHQNKFTLQQIIEKACAFRQEDRFKDVNEFLACLNQQQTVDYAHKPSEYGVRDEFGGDAAGELKRIRSQYSSLVKKLKVGSLILLLSILGAGVYFNRDHIIPQSKPAVTYTQTYTPTPASDKPTLQPTPMVTYGAEATPAQLPSPEATISPESTQRPIPEPRAIKSLEIIPEITPTETPTPTVTETPAPKPSLEDKIAEARRHFELGEKYRDQREYYMAKREYERALELKPAYATVYNSLGIVYHDTDRLDDAIRMYKKALELEPMDAVLHYNLGVVYRDQNKLEAALNEFKTAFELDPHDEDVKERLSDIYVKLGLYYERKDKLEDALRMYKKAAEIKPNDADIHILLAGIYAITGKPNDALNEVGIAWKLKPNNVFGFDDLGTLYEVRGALDLAIGAYKKGIEIDPNHSAYYYSSIGEVREKQGDWAEALSAYKTVLQLDPNYSKWTVKKIEKFERKIKQQEEKPTEARTYTPIPAKIEAISPAQSPARSTTRTIEDRVSEAKKHFDLGSKYDQQKNYPAAIREYQTAIELNPKYACAHQNLGTIYEEQGRIKDAVREYKTALSIDPNHINTHYTLGRVYVTQQLYDNAIEELRTVIRIKPEHADAHHQLGHIYEHLGKIDDAIREYQKTVEIAPNFQCPKDCLKKLEQRIAEQEKLDTPYSSTDITRYLNELQSQGKISSWRSNILLFIQNRRFAIADYVIDVNGRKAILEDNSDKSNDIGYEDGNYSDWLTHSSFNPISIVYYISSKGTVKQMHSTLDAAVSNACLRPNNPWQSPIFDQL